MHTGRRFPLWLSLLLLFYIRNLLAIESQCNHDSEYCQNGHSSPQVSNTVIYAGYVYMGICHVTAACT
jgi:hypothetical protein